MSGDKSLPEFTYSEMAKLSLEPISEPKVYSPFSAVGVESAEKWWLAGESVLARPMASAVGWVIRQGRRLKRVGLDSESTSRSPGQDI